LNCEEETANSKERTAGRELRESREFAPRRRGRLRVLFFDLVFAHASAARAQFTKKNFDFAHRSVAAATPIQIRVIREIRGQQFVDSYPRNPRNPRLAVRSFAVPALLRP
jgi:hypothetical protein